MAPPLILSREAGEGDHAKHGGGGGHRAPDPQINLSRRFDSPAAGQNPHPPGLSALLRTNLSPPSPTHARFTPFRTCCAVATNGRCGTPDGGEVAPLPMDKDDLDPAHPRVGCSARLRAGASIANGSYVAQAVLSSESPGYMGRGRSPKPSPTTASRLTSPHVAHPTRSQTMASGREACVPLPQRGGRDRAQRGGGGGHSVKQWNCPHHPCCLPPTDPLGTPHIPEHQQCLVIQSSSRRACRVASRIARPARSPRSTR